jgi:hypothetical protein
MLIDRSIWLQQTLDAFDYELILRTQPDNINKLPKLDEINILTNDRNFRHSFGFSKLASALVNPIPVPVFNKTSWFKVPKTNVNINRPRHGKRRLASVGTKIFPHHRSVDQLVPFLFFYFCLNNNKFSCIADYSLPNELRYKIKNLNYFTSYQWYFDRSTVDWGTTYVLSLKSYSGIEFFGPLFKFNIKEK